MLSGVLHQSGMQSLWCAKHTSFFTVQTDRQTHTHTVHAQLQIQRSLKFYYRLSAPCKTVHTRHPSPFLFFLFPVISHVIFPPSSKNVQKYWENSLGMWLTIVVTAAGCDCHRITATAKRSCLLPFSCFTARVLPTSGDQTDLNTRWPRITLSRMSTSEHAALQSPWLVVLPPYGQTIEPSQHINSRCGRVRPLICLTSFSSYNPEYHSTTSQSQPFFNYISEGSMLHISGVVCVVNGLGTKMLEGRFHTSISSIKDLFRSDTPV